MKLRVLILTALLAGCGKESGYNAAEPVSREQVQLGELTGHYELVGQPERRGRMCITPAASGTHPFGIVTETSDGGSCGGAGEAVRVADILRLTMAGDEDCLIEARIEGRQVTLPSSLPQGCAYYCSPDSTLAGTVFEKTGGTEDDAMRAKDLAGDPLCG